MKKIVAASVCLGAIISLLMSSALAVPPVPPSAWEHVFEEYNRIFYMTPTAHSEWVQESLIERHGQERMQIRSGLYYNADPLVSIYYVDWSFPRHNMFFSECGTHFAYVHGPSMTGLDGGAVCFFEYGSLTRTYLRGDLLHPISHSGGFFSDVITFWEEPELRRFDQQNNTLTIVTADRRAFTFDITTGEIIRGPIWRPSARMIFMVAALLAIIFILKRLRQKQNKNARQE